jgi:hypothetical protein
MAGSFPAHYDGSRSRCLRRAASAMAAGYRNSRLPVDRRWVVEDPEYRGVGGTGPLPDRRRSRRTGQNLARSRGSTSFLYFRNREF